MILQGHHGRCHIQRSRVRAAQHARKRSTLHNALKRKSTVAFPMSLPLILVVCILVIYPALCTGHLRGDGVQNLQSPCRMSKKVGMERVWDKNALAYAWTTQGYKD